jgi:hypothetical protein
VADGGRRKGRVGGGPESAGLRLRHVKQGRSARPGGGRMRERSFLDSESPKRAPMCRVSLEPIPNAALRRLVGL